MCDFYTRNNEVFKSKFCSQKGWLPKVLCSAPLPRESSQEKGETPLPRIAPLDRVRSRYGQTFRIVNPRNPSNKIVIAIQCFPVMDNANAHQLLTGC